MCFVSKCVKDGNFLITRKYSYRTCVYLVSFQSVISVFDCYNFFIHLNKLYSHNCLLNTQINLWVMSHQKINDRNLEAHMHMLAMLCNAVNNFEASTHTEQID